MLFTLLYADDTVFFSKSKEGLKLLLDKLKVFCDTLGKNVNVDKSKVMVF